jgi:hypothetical protein
MLTLAMSDQLPLEKQTESPKISTEHSENQIPEMSAIVSKVTG